MRERQKVKDRQMSIDSDSSLAIWDGRSKDALQTFDGLYSFNSRLVFI